MQRKNFIQNVTIIVLAVAIILMSVGYATFSVPLQITGTTTIEKATWGIVFDNVTALDNTTTVPTANITAPSLADTTHLSFGVKTTPLTTSITFSETMLTPK